MRHLIVILAATLASSAVAESADGQFAIKGAGMQTCGAFLDSADARSEDLPLYAGWVDGFVSAQNQHLPETFDIAPWQTTGTLVSLIRSVCQQAGRETRFMDAAVGMINALTAQRLTETSETSTIDMGTNRTVIYDAVLMQAEQALSDRGIDPGPIDGTYDDATSQALAAFQRDQGIPVSSLPDQQTLFALLLKSDAAPE